MKPSIARKRLFCGTFRILKAGFQKNIVKVIETEFCLPILLLASEKLQVGESIRKYDKLNTPAHALQYFVGE